MQLYNSVCGLENKGIMHRENCPQLMTGSATPSRSPPLPSEAIHVICSWWKKPNKCALRTIHVPQMPLLCTKYFIFPFLSSNIINFKNFYSHSSVNRSNKLMLKIMTNNPIVTIIKSANPNQPSIIAEVPTPLLTLPLPRSWAIVLAATDAVCCHSTDTRTKTEATKISARAIWETGREGKGFTSRSEPRSSTSSCQPGKVARSTKQKKARIMATILGKDHVSQLSQAVWNNNRGVNGWLTLSTETRCYL